MSTSCAKCGLGLAPVDECRCLDRCSECRYAGTTHHTKKLVHGYNCSKYIPWEDLGETVYEEGSVKITEAYYGYDSAFKVYINGKVRWEGGHIE